MKSQLIFWSIFSTIWYIKFQFTLQHMFQQLYWLQPNRHLFVQVSNWNKTMCEVSSKFRIKTLERRSIVFIVNFGQISQLIWELIFSFRPRSGREWLSDNVKFRCKGGIFILNGRINGFLLLSLFFWTSLINYSLTNLLFVLFVKYDLAKDKVKLKSKLKKGKVKESLEENHVVIK